MSKATDTQNENAVRNTTVENDLERKKKSNASAGHCSTGPR